VLLLVVTAYMYRSHTYGMQTTQTLGATTQGWRIANEGIACLPSSRTVHV